LQGIRNGKANIDTVFLEIGETYDSLKEVVHKYDLFVLDDSLDLGQKNELLKFFAYRDKPVYLVPGVYELMLLNPQAHFVNDITLFELNLVNITGVERTVKRILDILVSLVALLVFSPVIFFVTFAILLEDGRPIFYLQERAGVNGRVFKTIKFRTMIRNAEKYTGAVLSSDNDPRVTKAGKFLRKTGLDEIPQFINVLKGDMSVVGPRPERPELMENIKNGVPEFDMRLKVKPGITGFAQLHGKYDTAFDDKLKMDLLYAKQRNAIFTDIYVMFNTVKLFLLPKKRK
jgi:exopolysaccharide biosynthesis polyprenyl glycosylphosphotransferase